MHNQLMRDHANFELQMFMKAKWPEGDTEKYTPVSHIRLNPLEHIHCSLVHLQEDTTEDLF